jgi:hypothetical protein
MKYVAYHIESHQLLRSWNVMAQPSNTWFCPSIMLFRQVLDEPAT